MPPSQITDYGAIFYPRNYVFSTDGWQHCRGETIISKDGLVSVTNKPFQLLAGEIVTKSNVYRELAPVISIQVRLREGLLRRLSQMRNTGLEGFQVRWRRSMILELPSLTDSGTFALKTLLQIDNYLCLMSVQRSKCASSSYLFQINVQNLSKNV